MQLSGGVRRELLSCRCSGMSLYADAQALTLEAVRLLHVQWSESVL